MCRQLRLTGREIVLLSFQEMEGFAGNCLELRTRHDDLVLAISRTAVNALSPDNLAALQRHLRFLEANVDTIEAVGGGGLRCMLAEVLCEKKSYSQSHL